MSEGYTGEDAKERDAVRGEREHETVTGTVSGVTQKGDKWQVEVTPPGSKYPKRLWFKDRPTHDAVVNLYGREATFTCNVSRYTQDEQPRQSLWIESIGGSPAPEVARPAETLSVPQSGTSVPQWGTPAYREASDYTGDPRQQSIERQSALKAAVEFYAGQTVSETDVLATARAFAAFLESGLPLGPEPF